MTLFTRILYSKLFDDGTWPFLRDVFNRRLVMTLISRDQLDARLHGLSIDRLVKSFSEMRVRCSNLSEARLINSAFYSFLSFVT